jgi:hypothetical protein
MRLTARLSATKEAPIDGSSAPGERGGDLLGAEPGPVPADRGGQLSTARKFVLAGLPTPTRATGPNPDSQPSSSRCSAAIVGNSATESNPPTGSSAATTLKSNS